MSKRPGGREAFARGERVATKEEIPGGELLSLEIVNSSVHMGSHVDAPFHYGSTCEGKPAKQIMDVPLENLHHDV
ncbi:putative cyclase [compost metagenome]